MNKLLLTAPSVYPVSLAEAKEHLILETNDMDSLVDRFVKAATAHVEYRTGRAIVRQKWRIYLDYFADEVSLEPNPVQEIHQVQYVDVDGATQTVTSSIYTLDVAQQRLLKAYGQTWPTPRVQDNAVWIDVWAGYYDASTSPVNIRSLIPEDLKSAVLLMVGNLDQNRTMGIVGTSFAETPGFDLLIQPHRVFK